MGFRRVFIIGAGFSAGLGYPTGGTLVPWLVTRLAGLPDGATGERPRGNRAARHTLQLIRELLREFFARDLTVPPTSPEAIHKELDGLHVTEFFSVAHVLAESPALFRTPVAARGGAPGLTQLYDLLAAAARTFFTDLVHWRTPLPGDVDSLLGQIDPATDAVVTFNWDEELDLYFCQRSRAANVAYTLDSWKPGEELTLLLKPHGSINWYDAARGIANDGGYRIAARDRRLKRFQKRLIAYEDVDLPLDYFTREPFHPLACPPAILPPTFAKRFDYPEQQLIWRDVIAVCRQAKQFVFVGYSLPDDDYLTRAALRAALRETPRDDLRCLCVTGGEPDARTLAAYRGVLGEGFSPARNVLPHRLGTKPEFPDLAQHLETATIEGSGNG